MNPEFATTMDPEFSPENVPEEIHDATYMHEALHGTTAGAGTPEKIKVLAIRYYLGKPLWHPNDLVRSTGESPKLDRTHSTLGALLQLSTGSEFSETPEDDNLD